MDRISPRVAHLNAPAELGSFQTAHERLISWAVDGTGETALAAVLAAADADDAIACPYSPLNGQCIRLSLCA